jgi:hypothetical protein
MWYAILLSCPLRNKRICAAKKCRVFRPRLPTPPLTWSCSFSSYTDHCPSRQTNTDSRAEKTGIMPRRCWSPMRRTLPWSHLMRLTRKPRENQTTKVRRDIPHTPFHQLTVLDAVTTWQSPTPAIRPYEAPRLRDVEALRRSLDATNR